jgi:hypothetical protein
MSAIETRSTINMPKALQADIRLWAIEAAHQLGRPVSFQDACRAMLAAGISSQAAGKAALAQLKREAA